MSTAARIRALRGFPDIGPGDTPAWLALEASCERTLSAYGYAQVRMPILESTDLFARSVGEVTDIVEKEMFSFVDRDRNAMSLRPEGTASAVRLGIDGGLLHNAQCRLWYTGPMFRHERPQAGRYRQFHQVGVECFGTAGATADVEVIALSADLLRSAGVAGAVQLELNTLGSATARARYRDTLREWLQAHRDALDEDSRNRIERNPLRVLDSKHPETQALLATAPALAEHLDDESREHYAQLRTGLDALGIAYVENPRLVRGLDYYNHAVFEWTTTQLGAQGTVLAGGRYDGLVEQLGGGNVPACGFAMGMERVLLLQKAVGVPAGASVADVYVCHEGEGAAVRALQYAQELRRCGGTVIVDGGDGRLKGQIKRAAASAARIRLVVKPGHCDWTRLQNDSVPPHDAELIAQLDKMCAQTG